MLLRLRIRGFKNLKDVVVRFGPLTCFVGINAVGKSNVLDAVQFLKSQTEHDVQTAASLVRSPSTGEFGPRELFFGGDVSKLIAFVRRSINSLCVARRLNTSMYSPSSLLDTIAPRRPRCFEIILARALRKASGRSRRRLKRFRVARAVRRLAELIDDYSPLTELPAFQVFQDRPRRAIAPFQNAHRVDDR